MFQEDHNLVVYVYRESDGRPGHTWSSGEYNTDLICRVTNILPMVFIQLFRSIAKVNYQTSETYSNAHDLPTELRVTNKGYVEIRKLENDGNKTVLWKKGKTCTMTTSKYLSNSNNAFILSLIYHYIYQCIEIK